MKKYEDENVVVYFRQMLYFEVFFKESCIITKDIMFSIYKVVLRVEGAFPILLHSEVLFGVDFEAMEFAATSDNSIFNRLHIIVFNTEHISDKYSNQLCAMMDNARPIEVYNIYSIAKKRAIEYGKEVVKSLLK